MFIAALFTITKTWRQPKCSSTDERIRKMWYVYLIEYYLPVKKNKISLAATWMQLVIITLSEVLTLGCTNLIINQKEKDKYHMISYNTIFHLHCEI